MICKPGLKAFFKQMLFVVISFCFFSLTLIAQKPNIVFILADDVGYYTPAINGGESYLTPRIDSMARHGMNFTNCEASPLCSTSRSLLLTGKYNFRNYSNWSYMNPSETTVANMLHNAGYVTGIFGKHQLEYSVDTMKNWGWDYHCIFELTENPMKYSRYKNPVLMENGTVLSGADMQGKYGDDVLTDKIFSFMQTNKSKPFFVYYSMSIGHAPYCPTPDDAAFANWNPDKNVSDTSFYASMMHYMDKKVGQILDKLQQMGLAQNTLVIFAGDNGTPPEIYYNAHGVKNIKGEKGLPREGGTHVPMMAYWPTHIQEGSVNADLIDFTDFFPTFAQVANVTNLNAYKPLDGLSFYNGMLNKPHTSKQQLFFVFDSHPGFTDYRRWARDKVYKLYDSTDAIKAKLFYNTVLDEGETKPINSSKITAAEKAIKQNFQYMLDTMGVWPDAPKLNNPSASNITASSATITATIISSGSSKLIDRGSTIANANSQDPYLQIGRMHDTAVKLGTFSMKRTGLYPQMYYRYTLYAMNNNKAHSTDYAFSNFYTLSMAPVAQPPKFNAVAQSSVSVSLTWGNAKYPPVTGAKKAGYLVVYSTGVIKLADDPNGKPPAAAVVNGTIVSTPSTALPKTPPITVKVNGLTPSATYNFLLVPYTWNGTVADTYNYLTQNARTLTITMPASFALDNHQPDIKLTSTDDVTIIAAK